MGIKGTVAFEIHERSTVKAGVMPGDTFRRVEIHIINNIGFVRISKRLEDIAN